ncbi:hypothetical protein J3E69DRAFT_72122 [Trichoderma sp. SZMC 28015]
MLSSLSFLFSFSLYFLSPVFLSLFSPSYTIRGRDNDRESPGYLSSALSSRLPRFLTGSPSLYSLPYRVCFSVCISAHLRSFDPVRV